jgi:hypothetical protein
MNTRLLTLFRSNITPNIKPTNKSQFRLISFFESNKTDIYNNILLNPKISTEPNTDSSYKTIGIIHYTDTQGIDVLREFGTEVMNVFGKKGFDNPVYDQLRNESLNKVINIIETNPNYKISNLRMEFSHVNVNLIVHHIYGTLLEKNK